MNKHIDRLKDLIAQAEGFKNAPVNQAERLKNTHAQIRAYLGSMDDRLDVSRETTRKLCLDVKIILNSIFGENNEFSDSFSRVNSEIEEQYVMYAGQCQSILGILKSALDNLENGYLEKVESRLSNEIFDNLLAQAKHFVLVKKDKDIAALLLRIVLEDHIKRMCRHNNIEANQTTSRLNDELKGRDLYNQTQWRQIQAWLDIGNAAHHGKFAEYDLNQVENFSTGLEQFIAKGAN